MGPAKPSAAMTAAVFHEIMLLKCAPGAPRWPLAGILAIRWFLKSRPASAPAAGGLP
jgi:hypothetical protein